MQDINWLSEIFLTTGIWGLFGVFAVIAIGYYLAVKTDRFLALIWFVIECILIFQYVELAEETPFYYWDIVLLALGGIFLCLLPALNKK